MIVTKQDREFESTRINKTLGIGSRSNLNFPKAYLWFTISKTEITFSLYDKHLAYDAVKEIYKNRLKLTIFTMLYIFLSAINVLL